MAPKDLLKEARLEESLIEIEEKKGFNFVHLKYE